MTAIAIYIFDGAEELDWAGPWEVLAAWAQEFDDDIEVFTIADSLDPIRCAKGLRVFADYTIADAPRYDVLVYPGGRGMRAHVTDDQIHKWLRSKAEEGVLMTSVCTGSVVYAAAGLLDEGPATTHWGSLHWFDELGSNIEVRPDERFVDRGSVITAAGVSAGIDMALHLVARLSSRERAAEVRRYIQYDPEPPV